MIEELSNVRNTCRLIGKEKKNKTYLISDWKWDNLHIGRVKEKVRAAIDREGMVTKYLMPDPGETRKARATVSTRGPGSGHYEGS